MHIPILVALLKMQPHYSQSSHENVTLSHSTSPLASVLGSTPTPWGLGNSQWDLDTPFHLFWHYPSL